jgi:hypothetical protein
MIDYVGWLRRAEKFVRGTSRLRGEWSMEISVTPPLSPAQADRLTKTLPFELPSPLLQFYTTASANARCFYSWKPDKDALTKVRSVVVDTFSVYGRAEFCPAVDLAEHYEQLLGWSDRFRERDRHGPAAAETISNCVPLISVGNGDYVAINLGEMEGGASIVYVNHEADVEEQSPIIPLARDLDDFLMTSERLGYLGPEIWMLDALLEDSPSGLLDGDSRLARKWRAVMMEVGFPDISSR